MKKATRRTKLLLWIAIVSAVVLVASAVVSFAMVFGIYDCVGKTPEGGVCPELETAAAVTGITRIVSMVSVLTLVTSLFILLVDLLRRNPPKDPEDKL